MWLVERWRWFVYTPAATRDLVMAISCEHRGLRRERESVGDEGSKANGNWDRVPGICGRGQ